MSLNDATFKKAATWLKRKTKFRIMNILVIYNSIIWFRISNYKEDQQKNDKYLWDFGAGYSKWNEQNFIQWVYIPWSRDAT